MSTTGEPDDLDAVPELRITDATDEELEAMVPPFDPANPLTIGLLFVNSLMSDDFTLADRQTLVTPESLGWWGDFTTARQWLAGLDEPGFGSTINKAAGDPDVGYLKILPGVTTGYIVSGGEALVEAAGVVTLVWRPEHGRWMVHSLGGYVHPDEVPRG